jgi:hypothetical protein
MEALRSTYPKKLKVKGVKMIDLQTNNMKEDLSGKQLLGKVVLLIGQDTAVVQNLITQLAQKGADIALVCWQMPGETVRKIRANVQETGRHFLLLEQTEAVPKASMITQLIETISNEWGHLDIFIDLSAQKSDLAAISNGQAHKALPSAANWLLRKAVLEKIVHT